MAKFIFFQVALRPQSEATNFCSKEQSRWNSRSSKEKVLFVWKKQKEEAKNETAEVNTKTLTSTVNLQELNLPVKMDKNESN